jgi:hypothetical protein
MSDSRPHSRRGSRVRLAGSLALQASADGVTGPRESLAASDPARRHDSRPEHTRCLQRRLFLESTLKIIDQPKTADGLPPSWGPPELDLASGA